MCIYIYAYNGSNRIYIPKNISIFYMLRFFTDIAF